MMGLAAQPVRPGARILAVDGVRGELAVDNDALADAIDSSDQWIRQRTGIVTRTRAGRDTSMLDLAEQASKRVMERAGITPQLVDVVILATVTHLAQTPSAAVMLAERLGVAPAPAFDISAACAGYCYGIAQADALVRSGQAEHVLVVGAEKMTDLIDPADRTISFLLGDGAGAAIVGPANLPGIGPTIWGSDGAKADAIRQTHNWADALREGVWPTLRQEGPTVFKWASFSMAPVAREAIEAAGVTPDQIDVFVPHQANLRIIDQLAKQLGLRDNTLVARDVCATGNTSSASIPLGLEALRREHGPLGGKLALQIGFGAGLVYAAQVVELPAT
jgi:3-oxoacyl-[acyl-carrier-protein] synthase-3